MSISELCWLDKDGLHVPDYPRVLRFYQSGYRAIYGADTYLDADSQDGQWLAIQALAAFELMQLSAAVYASFSPATAQSDALSRNVRINGISRLVPSHSTVDLRLVGQVGSVIRNGQAEDDSGQKWLLPEEVVIPPAGEITVTATAEEIGAIRAPAGTITKIATPTLGWQTVNNPDAAAEGRPVETDAELRQRQAASTMLPSVSAMDGIVGGVLSLQGVMRCVGYENDAAETDQNGLAPHSICIVVQGGDAQAVADTIARKKTIGCGTTGTTEVTTYDQHGVANTTRFSRPREVRVVVEVDLRALRGYTTGIADAIRESIAWHITDLDIGESVLLTKQFTPANNAGGEAVDITSIRLARAGDTPTEASLVLAYDELAVCSMADVTVTAT